MRTNPLAYSGTIATVAILLLSALSVPAIIDGKGIVASAEDTSPTLNSTGELKKVQLFLMGTTGDFTITPPTKNDSEEASIPGTFTTTGLFGFGILPFGSASWQSFRSFRIPAIKQDMTVDDAIEFQFWVVGTSSGSCSFRLTLFQSGVQFGDVLTLDDQSISTNPGDPIKCEWKLNKSMTVKRGTMFTINMEVSDNYDTDSPFKLMWGTAQYDTSVIFTCDAIKPTSITSDGDCIVFAFTDAFGFPFEKAEYKRMITGTLNGEALGSEFVVGSVGSGKAATWQKKINGRNQIIISISYGNNVTWTMETFVEIPTDDSSFLTMRNIGIAAAVVVVVAIVALVVVKRSGGSRRPERTDDLDSEFDDLMNA